MPSMRKSKSGKRFSSCNSKPRPQTGGSPASTLLMSDATMNPPVMNDYAGPDRIRDKWYNSSLSPLEPKYGGQSGGSIASDLVMEQLNQKPKTETFDAAWSPKGDMNSLNLYETTGGARRRNRRSASRKNNKSKRRSRNNNSKSKRKSKRNSNRRNNRSRRSQRGGSAFISTLYSQSINTPAQPASYVGQFSQSGATSRSELMNPSTLGLAGSGFPMGSLEGANVRHIGSPL
jgi:hypothetical protein